MAQWHEGAPPVLVPNRAVCRSILFGGDGQLQLAYQLDNVADQSQANRAVAPVEVANNG